MHTGRNPDTDQLTQCSSYFVLCCSRWSKAATQCCYSASPMHAETYVDSHILLFCRATHADYKRYPFFFIPLLSTVSSHLIFLVAFCKQIPALILLLNSVWYSWVLEKARLGSSCYHLVKRLLVTWESSAVLRLYCFVFCVFSFLFRILNCEPPWVCCCKGSIKKKRENDKALLVITSKSDTSLPLSVIRFSGSFTHLQLQLISYASISRTPEITGYKSKQTVLRTCILQLLFL